MPGGSVPAGRNLTLRPGLPLAGGGGGTALHALSHTCTPHSLPPRPPRVPSLLIGGGQPPAPLDWLLLPAWSPPPPRAYIS